MALLQYLMHPAAFNYADGLYTTTYVSHIGVFIYFYMLSPPVKISLQVFMLSFVVHIRINAGINAAGHSVVLNGFKVQTTL